MIVLSRAGSGEWVKWRVGRQRLAWAPHGEGWSVPDFSGLEDGGHLGSLLMVGIVALLAVVLLGAFLWTLLKTVVVLPYRIAADRWPVVAYIVNGPEGYRVVTGRKEADELVRRWASEIRQHGQPVSAALRSGPSSTGSSR
ncbi:hypothetical protein ACQPZJ_42595 [Actinoplanes sp. CA-054009]